MSYSRIKCHEDLFDLPPIHVICSRFQDSSHKFSLRNVKEFNFGGYTSGYDYHYNSDEDEDICDLLNVSQCEKVTFQLCSSITDISLLQGCEQIILEICENIIDFSSLGKQRSLSINTNPHLINVMNFRSIRTLILEECCNLEDVSPLHGVYDLSLLSCEAVSDISSLGGHHRLHISGCNPILSEYHVLKDIPVVKLVDCDISDVSVLSNAKVVHLELCESLKDVSALRGVRELTLSCCSKIEDISMLTTVQKLTLENLCQLKNYKGINQMRNLCLQVGNLNDDMLQRFPNVKCIECLGLDLLCRSKASPFSSFTNLHSLTLCDGTVEIEVCVDIHTVIIERCRVNNISGLGKNRVVRLFHCVGDVLDVSSLAAVPLVSFIKCGFIKINYESLKNVPRLKIDDSDVIVVDKKAKFKY